MGDDETAFFCRKAEESERVPHEASLRRIIRIGQGSAIFSLSGQRTVKERGQVHLNSPEVNLTRMALTQAQDLTFRRSRFRALLSGIDPRRSAENVTAQVGRSVARRLARMSRRLPCRHSGAGRRSVITAQRVIALQQRSGSPHLRHATGCLRQHAKPMRFRPAPE